MKDLKTADLPTHPPNYWPTGGRPIEPFRISDELSEGDLYPTGGVYLLSPIHPHLLRLVPGGSASFLQFVGAVGVAEFLAWAYAVDRGMGVWAEMAERVGEGGRIQFGELTRAWKDESTAEAVRSVQRPLRAAFDAAVRETSTAEGVAAVASAGWVEGAFRIELFWNEAIGLVVERPSDLWSRAWFELLNGVRERALKACEHCGLPFVPVRSNQRYCTGTSCRRSAYERRRSTDPTRRAAQTERRREQRERQRDGGKN